MTINEDVARQYKNEPVRYAPLEVADLIGEARAVTDDYRNMVVSRVNDHCLRLAVFNEQYGWHYHPHSDELFVVVEGCLVIDFEKGKQLRLTALQSVAVPAGTLHRTRAEGRTVNLCVEKLGAETVFVDAPE